MEGVLALVPVESERIVPEAFARRRQPLHASVGLDLQALDVVVGAVRPAGRALLRRAVEQVEQRGDAAVLPADEHDAAAPGGVCPRRRGQRLAVGLRKRGVHGHADRRGQRLVLLLSVALHVAADLLMALAAIIGAPIWSNVAIYSSYVLLGSVSKSPSITSLLGSLVAEEERSRVFTLNSLMHAASVVVALPRLPRDASIEVNF